jgi:hypothetical protein
VEAARAVVEDNYPPDAPYDRQRWLVLRAALATAKAVSAEREAELDALRARFGDGPIVGGDDYEYTAGDGSTRIRGRESLERPTSPTETQSGPGHHSDR